MFRTKKQVVGLPRPLAENRFSIYSVGYRFVGNGNLKVSDMQVKMLRQKGRSEGLEYQEN